MNACNHYEKTQFSARSRETFHPGTCVSVEKRVAVTIYKLATNLEYRSLSNLFGIGLSTVRSSSGNMSSHCRQTAVQVCLHTAR